MAQERLEGDRLRDALADLCQRFGLAELYVFGSRTDEVAARVRGERLDGPELAIASDVDIGVRPFEASAWKSIRS